MSNDHDLYHIEGLNWAGLGIVKVNEKVRCVPLTKPSEQVRVRWHDAGWGRWIGERIDHEEVRIALDTQLDCEQARRCTGCSLRHLSTIEQQEAQAQSHLGALERLSLRTISNVPFHWLKGAERSAYRVRVTARVWSKRASVSLSTHPKEQEPANAVSHFNDYLIALRSRWGDVIDLSKCPNHPQRLRNLVKACTRWINHNAHDLNLSQSIENGLFHLARVSIQAGGGLPQWLILHFEDFSHRGSLKASERKKRLEYARILISQLKFDELLNDHPTLTIYADAKLQDQAQSSLSIRHIAGPGPKLWSCERGLPFVARPPAWLPQSPGTLESLRGIVARCLWGNLPNENRQSKDIQQKTSIFELGCGIGVLGIALVLERPQLNWIGVDLEPEAIACAQESAVLNQVDEQVQFIAQDGRRALAENSEVISHLIIHAMRRPLSGLLALAAHKQIKSICYLAPSAPSLARDLAEDEAYHLDALYFIDQMPGTAQAMTIAQLHLK